MDAAVEVPTVGIGAGSATTGQVRVWQDMAGLRGGKMAKFVKQYAGTEDLTSDAAKAYGEDVRSGHFPGPEHSFESAAARLHPHHPGRPLGLRH